MRTIRFIRKAFLNPARATQNHSLLKHILLKPVIFDLISYGMQLRDYRRLAKIRESAPDDVFLAKVHDYNAGVTENKIITTSRRAEMLYQALSLPARDLANEKLLIVGPRNVQELFIAWLYGYSWQNIQAIDLYSTNPKILVMNMEETSFTDNAFDAIAMSYTLAYAKDTFRCLSEMVRILKPSGRFVFGATYFPQGTAWPGNLVSGSQMRDMLKRLGFALNYYNASDKTNSLGGLQTVHAFAVQKKDATNPGFDRVDWL